MAMAQRRLWQIDDEPGEQRERPRRAVGVAGPEDLAPRRLQVEHEVDGPLDHRPHRLEEAAVVGAAASGATRRRRRRRRRWRRACPARSASAEVVLVPGAVGALHARPATRRPARPRRGARRRSSAIAASTWFHGSAWPPGNHGIMPDGQLPLGDGVDRRAQLGGASGRPRPRGGASQRSTRACGRRRRGSSRAPGCKTAVSDA